jgi:hypothetical protein
MSKKQGDRRSDEKSAARPSGGAKAGARRSTPDPAASPQGAGNPDATLMDKASPKPGPRRDDQDIFDSDRSDRESGRPIQLEDEDSERELESESADRRSETAGR